MKSWTLSHSPLPWSREQNALYPCKGAHIGRRAKHCHTGDKSIQNILHYKGTLKSVIILSLYIYIYIFISPSFSLSLSLTHTHKHTHFQMYVLSFIYLHRHVRLTDLTIVIPNSMVWPLTCTWYVLT